MNKIKVWILVIILIVIAIVISGNQGDGEERSVVSKTGSISGDIFLTADELYVAGDVAGDLFAASGDLKVNSEIDGEVAVAGGNLSIDGKVKGSLIVAGGNIDITADTDEGMVIVGGDVHVQNASITGNIFLVGGEVNLGKGLNVDGKVMAAGGKVHLDGIFSRDLRVAGGKVTIGGEIKGDVKVVSKHIRLLPGTTIAGSLIYYSPQVIDIADSVSIGKDIVYIKTSQIEKNREGLFFVAGLTFLSLLVGLILFSVLTVYIAPAMLPACNKRFQSHKGKALMTGLLLIFSGPVLSVLLISSVFGIPLGLGFICIYLLLGMIGYIVAVFILGERVLSLLGKSQSGSSLSQLLAVFIGILLMTVILLIPVLGVFVFLIVNAMGVGSMLLQVLFFRRSLLIRQIQ
ncbi:EI24 domain-containing protein [Motiliproteus sp. MSK22-1]|uniref:EI24 domain-containing protein n=1 Tax=Motiliproteus sp. MSK22-1 TaxID=1897630 RepID=UPI00117F099F|nr:EI24 domain-containing protein [Motiliproteus sp. MSK22-1]